MQEEILQQEPEKQKIHTVIAREVRENRKLQKLGFLQLVFDFYTTPLE